MITRHSLPVLLFAGIFVCLFAGTCLAVSSPVDAEHSTVTVRVFKEGLFSRFAHNHVIAAPILSGGVNAASLSVEIHFDARKLQVLDPGASVADRAKVQETMLGEKVLDAARFPEVSFVSRSVKPTGADSYGIEGELTLHGVTRPLMLAVSLQNGHYRGSAELKQTEFGITPISLFGGSVKVKDAVEISFDIVVRAK
ncbi:MAG: YceI family protein [Terriglobales bacterium]